MKAEEALYRELRREELRLAAEAGVPAPPVTFPNVTEPAQREREEHELAQHCPPRTWCDHCQMGRGKDKPHELLDASVQRLPVIGLDLCFLKGEPGATPGEPEGTGPSRDEEGCW